ncbi:hypothetical protein, partial [Leptospira santarosai]
IHDLAFQRFTKHAQLTIRLFFFVHFSFFSVKKKVNLFQAKTSRLGGIVISVLGMHSPIERPALRQQAAMR